MFSGIGQRKQVQYLDPRDDQEILLCGLPISVVHKYQHMISSPKDNTKSSLCFDLYHEVHWYLFSKVIRKICEQCESEVGYNRISEKSPKYYPIIDTNHLTPVLRLEKITTLLYSSQLLRTNIRGTKIPNYIDLMGFQMKIYQPTLTVIDLDNSELQQLTTETKSSCLLSGYSPLKLVTCKTFCSNDKPQKIHKDASEPKKTKRHGNHCSCKRNTTIDDNNDDGIIE